MALLRSFIIFGRAFTERCILLLLPLSFCLLTFNVKYSEELWDPFKYCWPFNVIPYIIERGFTEKQRQMILDQITHIQSKTCLRWVDLVEQNLNNTEYMLFTKHYDQMDWPCYFTLVKKYGAYKAIISLEDECFGQGMVPHEIMHALGFAHEHQRSDRDCYVNVKKHKDVDVNDAYYAIYPGEEWIEKFPYDKLSVMHFKRHYLLRAVTERWYQFEPLGNSEGRLTDIDLWKINYKFCNERHYCDVLPYACVAIERSKETCRKPSPQLINHTQSHG